ncbi:hypothetical protein [Niabella sp.]|uniref:hypothetical protein n=1 Tax=Niabella sp. TaxID=1962976 RepID=UPI0026372C95|nr:hypothetical protein [Niabella sp.]
MRTIAQRPADHLQKVLYRLLVHKEASPEPVTDYSERKGHFETALIIDPLGALFSMMTGKQALNAFTEKNKTR